MELFRSEVSKAFIIDFPFHLFLLYLLLFIFSQKKNYHSVIFSFSYACPLSLYFRISVMQFLRKWHKIFRNKKKNVLLIYLSTKKQCQLSFSWNCMALEEKQGKALAVVKLLNQFIFHFFDSLLHNVESYENEHHGQYCNLYPLRQALHKVYCNKLSGGSYCKVQIDAINDLSSWAEF